jgi:SAM-dependent methyltransferase
MGRAEDGRLFCEGGHELEFEHGVLDMYRAPPAEPVCEVETGKEEAIVSALAERLGLRAEEIRAAKLFEPLAPTGNAFFDAEEEIFFDRFAFSNIHPRLTVRNIHATGQMQAGSRHWLAVRVRNDGPFTITSGGERPVLLSYHWLDSAGEIVDFEGPRTPLPVDVKPGQAITAHLAVDVPSDRERLRLKVVPVHEYVSWLEDGGQTLEVEVLSHAPPLLPRLDADRPFSEALDDELAAQFLSGRLSSRSEPIIGIEIGGGIVAALSKWMWANGRTGAVVNGDVSVRLLRIAAMLSAKGADPATVHARFDANEMPIQSASADVVAFCRSLHHFEDPVRAMRECHRVLKPNGLLFLLCEPVATQYDEATKNLIRAGVNEQMFPLDAYQAMFAASGFACVEARCDWGFSLKAALVKAA